MSRLHYYAAITFLVASLFALIGPVVARSHPPIQALPAPHVADPAVPATRFSGARGWFQAVKQYCNPVEVEVTLRNNPAPEGRDGVAFTAACLALAGRIEGARKAILTLPQADRPNAAALVFDMAHPIADAGDDQSAGPIMGLVVEFWPSHYMALYHAGMANYGMGRTLIAKKYLAKFLELYHQEDGWRANAREVLGRMQ
jgi:hypothetical protein